MREIGIDVGGTFTDVYSQGSPGPPGPPGSPGSSGSGEAAFAKADTTDFDLKQGVLTALEELASKLGQPLEEMVGDAAKIVYSTTVGTNALLARKGPRLGLITTAGFDDTL